MGELLTRGKHYKVQRVDGVVDEEEVQPRRDEDGGHLAPAPRRGGEASAALGDGCPLPLLLP